MDRRRIWLWIGVPIALIAVAYVWYSGFPPTASTATTKLEIEIDGGFAYIPKPADNRLSIAFLDDFTHTAKDPQTGTDVVYCDVRQLGTELVVERGDITSTTGGPTPSNKTYNLDGAQVTFPALEAANMSLAATRGPRPPSPGRPVDPDNDGHWADLKFVGSLKVEHAGTDVHPDWQNIVNGWLSVKGGTIKGRKPTLVKLVKAGFDFKKGGVSQFEQALTDRTEYVVDVPGSSIEIELKNASSGVTRIVIAPQGNRVRLKLMGLHDMSKQELKPGEELKDFCAFYQLLDPRPDPKDWLRPHYVPATVVSASTATPQPIGTSPGFFCPGDWF
jgi:hypothetical protein